MYVCMYVCKYACMYICINTYIYTHTDILHTQYTHLGESGVVKPLYLRGQQFTKFLHRKHKCFTVQIICPPGREWCSQTRWIEAGPRRIWWRRLRKCPWSQNSTRPPAAAIACAHLCAYVCVCIHMYTYIHMYINTSMCVCMYVNIHTETQTHITVGVVHVIGHGDR